MSHLAYVVRQLLEQLEVGLDVRDLRLQLGPDELDLLMSHLAYVVRQLLEQLEVGLTCATFGSSSALTSSTS